MSRVRRRRFRHLRDGRPSAGQSPLARRPSAPVQVERARRLGHRIETLTTTARQVARDTTATPEPSPAATVRAELDAAITTEGLSRNVGERVLAAIATDAGVFASASLDQLKAYVGAAVGAGDPLRVRQLIDAAPEAHRATLTVRARDAFWFQSDLDSWVLQAIFSPNPLPAFNAFRRQPYFRRGTILVDSGLDDRLRLAQAVQFRLEETPPHPPPELAPFFEQLRRVARSAETSRFDALRAVEPSGAAPSRLAGYQRGLVTWARLQIDPTLDPQEPTSYDKARRLGWYHDRDTVLRFLAQGAGLSQKQTTSLTEQIGALSESQRLRFVGWLLGTRPEADKLGWIRSQAKVQGHASSLGTRVDAAEETQSFLAAFKVSTPPDLDAIDDLPSLLAVLDQWELTARGYVDTMRALRYQQLLREQRLAERGELNNQGGVQRSLELWRNGGPEDVVQFIAQVIGAREKARTARTTLAGLKRYDSEDTVDPNAVTRDVESARGVLGQSHALLAKLTPDAQGFVDEIFVKGKKTQELSAENNRATANSSWLPSGLRSAFSAVGGFVDKLKQPETWRTALEIGLEVAGAAFSGGASVLIKLVHWLVTTGASLRETVTSVVAKVRTLTKPGGLAKMVPLHQLTGDGLISATVGALFGEVPAKPQLVEPAAEGDTKTTPQNGKPHPAARLLAKVGSLVDTMRGAAAKVIDPTWAALGALDITRYEPFQTFARAYFRLMRFGDPVGKGRQTAGVFVETLRGRLGSFFQGFRGRLSAAVQRFSSPKAKVDAWVRQVTRSGLDYLVRLLIENPPSAILRTTFKLAASLLGTDTGDLAASIRQKLAGVPLIGDMVAKIESTAGGAIEPVVREPATQLHAAGQDLFGQAEPAIQGLQDQIGSVLNDTDRFVDQLTDGRWSQETSQANPVSAQDDGVVQKKRNERAPSAISHDASPLLEPMVSALLDSPTMGHAAPRSAVPTARSRPTITSSSSPRRIARNTEQPNPKPRRWWAKWVDQLKAKLASSGVSSEEHKKTKKLIERYFDLGNRARESGDDPGRAAAAGMTKTVASRQAFEAIKKRVVKLLRKHWLIKDIQAAYKHVTITDYKDNLGVQEPVYGVQDQKAFGKLVTKIKESFQRETGIELVPVDIERLRSRSESAPDQDLDGPHSLPVGAVQEDYLGDGLSKNTASYRWIRGKLAYADPIEPVELLATLKHEIVFYLSVHVCRQYGPDGKMPRFGDSAFNLEVERILFPKS